MENKSLDMELVQHKRIMQQIDDRRYTYRVVRNMVSSPKIMKKMNEQMIAECLGVPIEKVKALKEEEDNKCTGFKIIAKLNDYLKRVMFYEDGLEEIHQAEEVGFETVYYTNIKGQDCAVIELSTNRSVPMIELFTNENAIAYGAKKENEATEKDDEENQDDELEIYLETENVTLLTKYYDTLVQRVYNYAQDFTKDSIHLIPNLTNKEYTINVDNGTVVISFSLQKVENEEKDEEENEESFVIKMSLHSMYIIYPLLELYPIYKL